MKLQEPLTYIINETHPKHIGFFKVKNNEYLISSGIQTLIMNEILHDKYCIITGKDVIPFIIYHNYIIDFAIKQLKNTSKGSNNIIKHTKNAYIENELDTDMTINDIIKEVRGMNPETFELSDEDIGYLVYNHLVDKYIR